MGTTEKKLNDLLERTEIDKTELERHRVMTLVPIDEEVIERIKSNSEISIHSPISFQVKNAVIELATNIYGRDGEPLEIKYPKTWWDHLKRDWFPEWLKEKFPVEYELETYQPKQFFPDIPYNKNTIEFITNKGELF